MSSSRYLILGGARSGKSHYAENVAFELEAKHKEVIYIATATVLDDEMKQRVTRHKHDRSATWKTIEEPLALADTLQQWASPNRVILVDCLTLWMMNLLSDADESRLDKECKQLLTDLPHYAGTIIFVSNEVGMGIIPMGELTRKYVDEAGRLHQQLAQQMDNVILMVAGLPMVVKA